MRILHLPLNVAGGPQGMAEGERSLGHQATVLTTEQPGFGFSSETHVDVHSGGPLARLWKSARLLAEIRSGYDLYDFGFGSSLLHFPRAGLMHLDLPFYDRSAKKVFTYQGCDARQRQGIIDRNQAAGNPVAACFNDGCYEGACLSGQRDSIRRRAIDKAARYADHMFALNPDLVAFLPQGCGSFLPYAIAGFHALPTKRTPFFQDGVVHVVHAPTQRGVKGSDVILTILDELDREMPGRLRVTLVEGKTVDQARDIYASADLLIDQLLVGWYGGVAVEAMKIGLPVIGYINDLYTDVVPSGLMADLPIIRATPFTVKEVLRKVLREREQLPDVAAAGRAFVDKWHDPAKVAAMALDRVFGASAAALGV